MNVLETNPKTFDFTTNNVEVMTLDTLQRTYQENDTAGRPIQGIYHFQLIHRILEICKQHNMNYEIEEIFAAQNKQKNFPGVTINPQYEAIHGEKAVEAHALRRVFTTVQLKDGETDELTTTLAIAFHQDGIQVAIGPCVKICHNQCVLSAQRSACNFGKDKIGTEDLFGKVDEWLGQFDTQMNEDRERILRLKATVLTAQDIFAIIGLLTTFRVAHDSKDKRLSNLVKSYPLNQAQISVFTENLIKKQLEKSQLTAWDVYNVATEILKPNRAEIPAILTQNIAFADFLFQYYATDNASSVLQNGIISLPV
ncbi:DUF932 domain-containing protein [Bacteroides fragilis]|uniref:DUF932 domain-containing protein n=1 Tax=Bacteroides fragilis TaxID=817 RepID=A0A396C5S0_BACFG|nr:DUF932 domain-containing protein [Bacteroides fragilis]RHH14433.1 DUF932 domain-containing protein [Bacteroides fragilis]